MDDFDFDEVVPQADMIELPHDCSVEKIQGVLDGRKNTNNSV